MDNLTHTLLGLSIAKAGLERATPLATTTLVISSNLPDVDVLGRLRGGTLGYLEYHRGFTHGFVGLA
ncbi:MAG TPA: metal-dependent hydrolase, partial [Blastocatellia bacterium]|nr:metal-dependent hydrolase [Blastocatellia bacterium]